MRAAAGVIAGIILLASNIASAGSSIGSCDWQGNCGDAGASGGAAPTTIVKIPDGATGVIWNLVSCQSVVVTNRLRTAATQLNLCAATAGMEVWVVWENAAQTITIEPKDLETISTPEVTGTGDGLSWIATGTVGSVVHLLCISTGEWRVMSFKGSAAIDNDSGAGENLLLQ